MKVSLNDETQTFVEDLKQRSDVTGIVLFGSWARGNNRPDSDVDLLVILTDGFKRTVEYRNQQAFEIIYTTPQPALDFWKNNLNDCAGLWEVTQILYDKEGMVHQLQQAAEELLKLGKPPIDGDQLGQFRFDAEDQLRYVERIRHDDPTTANLILTNKVFALTELFFDIRQLWTPAPKQRLAKIQAISPELHILLEAFYHESTRLDEKLTIARNMLPIVFQD
jgi:hypothetical protein